MLKLSPAPLLVGCISTEAQLRKCALRAPAGCSAVEVRLDLTGLCGGEWQRLCVNLLQRNMQVILTIRSTREGGQWSGTEPARLALLRRGFVLGVSAVDWEIQSRSFPAVVRGAHYYQVPVIGSFHDFTGTPKLKELIAIARSGRKAGSDIIKIATMVHTPDDLAQLFALPAHARGPICVIGMGAAGVISRVALPQAGSCMAFGTLDAPTAPGQLTFRELAKALKASRKR